MRKENDFLEADYATIDPPSSFVVKPLHPLVSSFPFFTINSNNVGNHGFLCAKTSSYFFPFLVTFPLEF